MRAAVSMAGWGLQAQETSRGTHWLGQRGRSAVSCHLAKQRWYSQCLTSMSRTAEADKQESDQARSW